jgi:hypothetical protein
MDPLLPYDPGVLPTKPCPPVGEEIVIEVDGFPPYKDEHQSIRNRRHPNHDAFRALRAAAIRAMDGRAWYFGAIAMRFELFAPALPRGLRLIDFAAGIEDTLDGSSGCTFTFLPIVFEDDCQVCAFESVITESPHTKYRLTIRSLGEPAAE